MNHIANSAQVQQRFIRSQKARSDCQSIFNLLMSDMLFDEVEAHLPKHRGRIFPPTETLAMFIAQTLSADRSCQYAVNQAAVHRLITGLPQCSTHTGGYCRARQRLPTDMVVGLTRYLGQYIDRKLPNEWRWQGHRVCLVDGTTVTMPDTPENQATYPQQRKQKLGLGFPICRIVGITCLASGALLNAAMGRFNGKGSDEQTLLRSIQDTFEPGDIVMGDAFFPTFFFIAAMQAKGVDILMEQLGIKRRVTDFRHGKKLGQRDHLITLKKPKKKPDWMTTATYEATPETLVVRECKAGGKILVTTLCVPKTASKSDLKALYKQRWQIELDIRSIKQTMAMDVLSCKTPDRVLKEIWVHLLAYNLIRLLMAQAAFITQTAPRKISFMHCLQLWLIWHHKADSFDDEQLYDLCLLMAQQQVGNRSGRIEPRAVKRRPKPYPLLTPNRYEATENIRKFGHPKKAK